MRQGAVTANLGFVLVFAALVGALFLSVLLVVEVWQYEPMAGALVVTALPVGTFIARFLGARLGASAAAIGGAALLAGGLVGLAVLPGAAPWFAAASLVRMRHRLRPLRRGARPGRHPGDGRGGACRVDHPRPPATPASCSGWCCWRPCWPPTSSKGADEAVLLGTATLLDGRVELTEKVPLALALRDEIEATPEGEVPDLGAVFEARGAGDDADLATVRDDLVASIEDGLTRAFRPAFLGAAALALLALLPALAVAGRRGLAARRAVGGAVLAVALVGGGAVVGAALARGSWDQGVLRGRRSVHHDT